MKKSVISIEVELDENNIPDKIVWSASDLKGQINTAKAMNLSFWDSKTRETMKMDLWIKEMPVPEMKIFFIDMLGSMSDTIYNASGDEYMSSEIRKLGEKLMQKVEDEYK